MMYREITAVCSEIHIKHGKGEKANFLDRKPGGA
jgi:hypothetical protein